MEEINIDQLKAIGNLGEIENIHELSKDQKKKQLAEFKKQFTQFAENFPTSMECLFVTNDPEMQTAKLYTKPFYFLQIYRMLIRLRLVSSEKTVEIELNFKTMKMTKNQTPIAIGSYPPFMTVIKRFQDDVKNNKAWIFYEKKDVLV